MSRAVKIQWLAEPENHDYPAAQSYLNLLYDDKQSRRFITALKDAPPAQFKAKDIFRAARLPLLGASNSHVEKDVKKIRAGQHRMPGNRGQQCQCVEKQVMALPGDELRE